MLSIKRGFLLFEQIISNFGYDCSIHSVLGGTLNTIPHTSPPSSHVVRYLHEQLNHSTTTFADKPQALFTRTETFLRAFKLEKSEFAEDC